MDPRRSEHRVKVDLPVAFVDESGEWVEGRATDLSVGGIRVETTASLSFAARVTVYVRLPGAVQALALPAVVRWTQAGALGLQLGLLGARETHLIAALAVPRSQTLGAEDVAWVG